MSKYLSVRGDPQVASNKLHFSINGDSVDVDDAVRMVNERISEARSDYRKAEAMEKDRDVWMKKEDDCKIRLAEAESERDSLNRRYEMEKEHNRKYRREAEKELDTARRHRDAAQQRERILKTKLADLTEHRDSVLRLLAKVEKWEKELLDAAVESMRGIERHQMTEAEMKLLDVLEKRGARKKGTTTCTCTPKKSFKGVFHAPTCNTRTEKGTTA